jgi:DNA-binding transcriptional regulator PaaX
MSQKKDLAMPVRLAALSRSMKDDLKAEDWLAMLAYTLQVMTRPNLLLSGYTPWYRRSDTFSRDLRKLRRTGMLELHGRGAAKRAVRLSEKTLNKPDFAPDRFWDRGWDGKWRVLAFDLKLEEQALRNTLWRWLRARRFGLLQRSVWISVDPIGPLPQALLRPRLDSKAIHTFETSSISSRAPLELVQMCWDFGGVNELYKDLEAIHERGMELAENYTTKPETKRRWLAQERAAWNAAISLDPLLPHELHPPDYAGPQAFIRRKQVFRALANE